MKKTWILLLCALMLVACLPEEAAQPAQVSVVAGTRNIPHDTISVYVDRDRGVVCWIYASSCRRGGISCIPCSQLKDGACE